MLLEGAGGGWGSTALAAVTTITGPGGYVGGVGWGGVQDRGRMPVDPRILRA